MQCAWKRVKANKGAAGVDGLDISQATEHLKHAWPTIRQQLLDGTYRPQPVRRVGIPKPDGSERELGIPSVTDRLIQQALLQVLQPLIDPTFSEHSYGFRPGRRAQDAVLAAQRYAQQGCHTVVDVDLSKFFDRVNHDILIDRLSKRVNAAGVIRLVAPHLPRPLRGSCRRDQPTASACTKRQIGALFFRGVFSSVGKNARI
jgi:group II intron reverse transcriptase/maturase